MWSAISVVYFPRCKQIKKGLVFNLPLLLVLLIFPFLRALFPSQTFWLWLHPQPFVISSCKKKRFSSSSITGLRYNKVGSDREKYKGPQTHRQIGFESWGNWIREKKLKIVQNLTWYVGCCYLRNAISMWYGISQQSCVRQARRQRRERKRRERNAKSLQVHKATREDCREERG